MQQPVLQTLGSWLAVAYAAYAIVVVVGCIFAVHALVLLFALRVARPARWASVRFKNLVLGIELLYGLANPLVYLVLLTRMPGSTWYQTAWLTTPAWALLFLFWGARLVGRHPDQDTEGWRRALQLVLAASLVTIVVYLAKDLASVVTDPRTSPAFFISADPVGRLLYLSTSAGYVALYLVPAVLLVAHLRATMTTASWVAERRYLLGDVRGVRPTALAMATVVAATLLVSLRWAGDGSTRAVVLHQRDRIVTAANAQGIDPRLLASLVYVVQRDTVSPLSASIEQLVMGAWLRDVPNLPLDASIGLTQVKPTTALDAISVQLSAVAPQAWQNWSWAKAHPLAPLGADWVLSAEAAGRLTSPFARPPAKDEVAQRLFTDDGSLAVAAFILALYEAQWRSADPAWEISSKPEITATLYQIGFARSHPHADPHANEFGDAVGRVYRSPWMQEQFAGALGAQRGRPSE